MSTKSEQLEQESEGEEVEEDEVCASCGVAAVDDVKLKTCDGGCDLVKYCSDNCQENHREQHEAACKKRKAELHDKELFEQPDSSYLGECPICCLPLHLSMSKSTLMGCCCKIICKGCDYANQMRENEQGLENRCPYCREPLPNLQEEHFKRVMKRIKKHDDPVAMTAMGKEHDREGDYGEASKYYRKAAELGDVSAHFCLGDFYCNGSGVEKDTKKATYHFEQAAIGGHPGARSFLAVYEFMNDRPKRAAKHYIINANLGCNQSLQIVKLYFVRGVVSKEEYAAALRGYQSAVNEAKSDEREKAEAF